jgi:hypothetical protein
MSRAEQSIKAGVKVETFGELQSTSGKPWTECTFEIGII